MTEHAEQQLPVINDNPYIHDLVSADLLHRKEVGRERYGTPLQMDNGRDVLRDAYEESLDQSVYLRQAIEERNLRLDQLRERFAHVLGDYLVGNWQDVLDALVDQAAPFVRTDKER